MQKSSSKNPDEIERQVGLTILDAIEAARTKNTAPFLDPAQVAAQRLLDIGAVQVTMDDNGRVHLDITHLLAGATTTCAILLNLAARLSDNDLDTVTQLIRDMIKKT